MKTQRKWLGLIALLAIIAYVTTFNYGGCGGGGGGGSSGSSAPAIAAPSNLQATKSFGYVDLTWTDNSNNEAFFSIYVKPAGAGWIMSYNSPVTGGTTAISLDIVILQIYYPTATTLYFGVTAIDSNGIESALSNVVSATIP